MDRETRCESSGTVGVCVPVKPLYGVALEQPLSIALGGMTMAGPVVSSRARGSGLLHGDRTWPSWRTAASGEPQGTEEFGERQPLLSNSSKVLKGAELPAAAAPGVDLAADLASANAVASSAAKRVARIELPISGETSETS